MPKLGQSLVAAMLVIGAGAFAQTVGPSDMPAPFSTPVVVKVPHIVPRPPDAGLSMPKGFAVAPFSTGLNKPRTMRFARNGDLFDMA